MELIIDDTCTLSEIQESFCARFPFLKLEFFEFDPEEEKIFSKQNLITGKNIKVGHIRHIRNMGKVVIHEKQIVSDLEKEFKEGFGIYIQVFRKSGTNWLLTTATDSWSLAEQNMKGAEMNSPVPVEPVDDSEQYHEQP